MNFDMSFALICIFIGILIAVPLTLLLDRRSTRFRKKADEYWQTIVRLEAERDAQVQKDQAHIDELKHMLTEFEKKLVATADSALNRNSTHFIKLANENFEKFNKEATLDLESRKESIKNIVSPLKENLTKYEESLRKLELDRRDAYTSINEQIKIINQSNESLRQETSRLVQALHKPKIRGRWGEIQLRNVLEHVGMSEHIDFNQEKSFDVADGKKRPDVVVNLPGDKCIVIDAKTPLEAYLTGIEAESESRQTELFKNHAKQLRNQVKVLSDSNYQNAVPNTLDYVIMFIPGESFYSVAMQHDPNLFDYALKHQVMIATPTSLVVMLKVIALGWQQVKLTENSIEIAKIGRELYERLATFNDHMRDLGKSLTQTVVSFDKTVGSLERRVLPSTRKLEALEVVPVSAQHHKELPPKLDRHPRPVVELDSDDN